MKLYHNGSQITSENSTQLATIDELTFESLTLVAFNASRSLITIVMMNNLDRYSMRDNSHIQLCSVQSSMLSLSLSLSSLSSSSSLSPPPLKSVFSLFLQKLLLTVRTEFGLSTFMLPINDDGDWNKNKDERH